MTQVDFYDKGQIDAKEIGAPDDAASSTGSLWARIKNAVARIINLETADVNNVKKTGTSTVTGALQVPTTPPTPTSAVNDVYVNNASEGVNNLIHKNGDEIKNGTLYTQGYPIKHKLTIANNERIAANDFFRIGTYDKNNNSMGEVGFTIRSNGTRDAMLYAAAENGQTVIFKIMADNSGTPANPVITRYATLSNIRVNNAAQVSGNTTYDQDVVTIGMLKKLGLIS